MSANLSHENPHPMLVNESEDASSNALFLIAASLLTLFIARFLFTRLLWAAGVSGGRRRHTALLIGLCGSGKTALFAQLVANRRVSTRTSMQQISGTLSKRDDGSAASVTLVDFPGHRRLRESLSAALQEAKRVVLVVDAVTIDDDRHEGAQALAELCVSVFTSPDFYGVQSVLVACTKRDELTSYSARAVRKMLEAEISRCIATRRGDVQSVDTVVDNAGVAVKRRKKQSGGGRCHAMELSESEKFSFDSFVVPVTFADVSAFPDAENHSFGVDDVRRFLLEMN